MLRSPVLISVLIWTPMTVVLVHYWDTSLDLSMIITCTPCPAFVWGITQRLWKVVTWILIHVIYLWRHCSHSPNAHFYWFLLRNNIILIDFFPSQIVSVKMRNAKMPVSWGGFFSWDRMRWKPYIMTVSLLKGSLQCVGIFRSM